MASFISMKIVWHPHRDKSLQCQVCSENQIRKGSEYGCKDCGNMHLCVLGFTTLRVPHKYGRVYNYNLFLGLFLLLKHTYILGDVYQSYLCNLKRCLCLGFFLIEELLRSGTPRLRISFLALIPALVWTDPSSCVLIYFSL